MADFMHIMYLFGTLGWPRERLHVPCTQLPGYGLPALPYSSFAEQGVEGGAGGGARPRPGRGVARG